MERHLLTTLEASFMIVIFQSTKSEVRPLLYKDLFDWFIIGVEKLIYTAYVIAVACFIDLKAIRNAKNPISIVSLTYLEVLCTYTSVGSAKANGREPNSCLGWVFNFKLGHFAS